MPFGGHQQICRSKILSHLPFIHLLPATIYRLLLRAFRESDGCVAELLSIKYTRVTIESFENLVKKTSLSIQNRELWFINPHYKIKFGLSPRKLSKYIARIPVFRNFFSTSCFYILTRKKLTWVHNSVSKRQARVTERVGYFPCLPQKEDEQKFEGIGALVAQLQQDKETIIRLLGWKFETQISADFRRLFFIYHRGRREIK